MEFLNQPEAKIVLGLTVLLNVTAVAVYIVMKVRNRALGGDSTPRSDHLSVFREMYEQGNISEFEYRRVKSELRGAVKDQLPDGSTSSPAEDESQN